MESIKFFKLISPYPEDVTLNCKPTVEDLDYDFLTLKDYDVSGTTYNSESMIISIVRNNGEIINIDISEIANQIDTKIEEAISGTSGSCECNIDLHGELQNDGTLILSWKAGDNEYETSVQGFLTESNQVMHDSSLEGHATVTDPLKLAELEKTGYYKTALAIVDELPGEASIGDRYITKKTISSFGRLYNQIGLSILKDRLAENGIWRIPTKDDWDKLLNFAEACDETKHGGDGLAEYFGDIAGKVLKSVDYWTNENLDTFGFSVVPSGYAKPDGELVVDNAMFWTDTLTDSGKNFVKGFADDNDGVWQDEAEDEYYYSVRLVRDVEDKFDISNNILGNNYGIINFGAIGQAWTSSSILFETGNSTSRQFDYDIEGPAINKEVYIINVWNGTRWEQKELVNGDIVSVGTNGNVVEYRCITGTDGNQSFIPWVKFQEKGDKVHVYIDGGWY